MQTQDLERIRFVTRYYRDLRGLHLVSSGLLFLSIGLARTRSGTVMLLLNLALCAGSIGLNFFAKSYYRRTFGEVERRRWSRTQVNLAVILGAVVVLGSFLVQRKVSEGRFYYALFGAMFLGAWIWRQCRLSQSYYLGLGVLLLALAVPGPSAVFLPALAATGALIVCGTVLILAGLLDHRQLVRTLGPSAATSQDEQEDAEPLEAKR